MYYSVQFLKELHHTLLQKRFPRIDYIIIKEGRLDIQKVKKLRQIQHYNARDGHIKKGKLE